MSEPILDTTLPTDSPEVSQSHDEKKLSALPIKHGMRKRGFSRRHFFRLAAAGAATLAANTALHSLVENPRTAHAASSLSSPDKLSSPSTNITEKTRDQNSLAELAERAGKTVGVDLTGWWFNDPKWREIVGSEFNVGAIEHGLHWSDIEPEQGKLDFSIADRMAKFGKESGMKLRGYHLLWGNQKFLPDWLKNGNFSAPEMEEVIRNHISQIMTRYRGSIDEWVVVNEPYKTPLRIRSDDVFFDKLGKDYVRIAFDEARKVDPNARLILNDTQNHSTTGLSFVHLDKEIIAMLSAAGLVNDKFALGIQGHIKGSSPLPQDVTETLKGYGVKTILSECDVDMTDVAGSPQQRNSIQSERLAQFLEAVEASGTCSDYTFWGIGDKNSWLEKGGKPDADPTIYDDNLNPKPALAATKAFFLNITS